MLTTAPIFRERIGRQRLLSRSRAIVLTIAILVLLRESAAREQQMQVPHHSNGGKGVAQWWPGIKTYKEGERLLELGNLFFGKRVGLLAIASR
jgi:hypothetical protein